MTPGTETVTASSGKKAGGGKGAKKSSRSKQQKQHRVAPGTSTNQQQPQVRVPPTGNEPELEPQCTRQHLGSSACFIEIPCDGPMCCLTKLACQGLDCGGNVCNSLEDYSKRAKELKDDISSVLEKNTYSQTTDQPIEVIKLKEDIQKLSELNGGAGGHDLETDSSPTAEQQSGPYPQPNNKSLQDIDHKGTHATDKPALNSGDTIDIKLEQAFSAEGNAGLENTSSQKDNSKQQNVLDSSGSSILVTPNVHAESSKKVDQESNRFKNSLILSKTNKRISDNRTKPIKNEKNGQKNDSESQNQHCILRSEFEPLNNVNLDFESKYLTIISTLKPHFKDVPQLLEPISHKLASMSDEYRQLAMETKKQRLDNQKLEKMKEKLESLCRELQKTNNAIRVESLDLIKVEQGKTKEQNTKIQSTLSGVIKLFDENQQRNMSLRQENQDLQIKLKSLLDHCDNWERSVETALRQREIENRLIKTELAKANLVKAEEKEKFLGEKQELLHILSMMQEQQHKIEGQEAKLRSDLSSYASKYDECQAVISKGMSRFQIESKKMLLQIEKSKQDYKVLLSKYESSNKRMVQLLEEKKCWDRAMSLANKKIDTLERLCRALSGRKLENSNKLASQHNNIINQAGTKNKNKLSKDAKSQNGSVISTEKLVDESSTEALCSELERTKINEVSVNVASTESIGEDSNTIGVQSELQSHQELLTH